MDFGIQLDGKKEAARYFTAKPRQIERATRLTINKVVRSMHREAGGTLPRRAGTSVVGYRRARAKRSLAKARRKRTVGSVWMGTMKIPAKYAGKIRSAKGGARAGRLFFKNAFVAKMAHGYEGIFRRKDGGRGVEQVHVDMPNAASDMRRIKDRNGPIIRRLLHAELVRQFKRK